ncbi:hypothetical protein GTA08_BOTSDO12913 [Botryosphaeria dothidea]|uniref:Uncharacterized protein n=1 Tax=Botryosphaeria dothidea TaxID=55169 RepID=A0A8H4J1U5_9PEZI|nr:hypothetical protein GTA08_BOTSDO12913 [Botryosphaeria dothidea]
MDATGRHIDAFFTQHDGPLESYLRQQILGNARVVYSRPCPPYASSGPGGDDKDDGRGDEEFEVVLLSRLVTKGGFHEEIMAYTAILVGWWWEEEDEESKEEMETDKEEEKGGGGSDDETSLAENVKAAIKDFSISGERKDGMSEKSGDADEAREQEPRKRGRKLRRRVAQTGAVDCRSSSKALRTLAKEAIRDAGAWLYADGQEEMMQDVNVLLEERSRREAEESDRLRDAREATVQRQSQILDPDFY